MAKPSNEFYDTDRLTVWLIKLLYMMLALTLVSLVSTIFELRLLDAIEQGNFASEEEMNAAADANDGRQGVIGILEVLSFVIVGILSLTWIYRSAHNAHVHARHMDYTSGSAVWWYFIPIASLWKPYGAMKEIFAESEKQAGVTSGSYSALLGVWWAAWLATTIASNALLRMSLRADDIDELRAVDKLAIFVGVVDLIALSMFLLMVKRLSALQERVRENPPAPQPAMPGANW
jgi:hypothetical protein